MPKPHEMSGAAKNLLVDKGEFDAILNRLLATPPKPVTPKRKARKKPRAKQA